MKVTFYSTGCPRCKVLKKKLEEVGVAFTENNSIDDMLSLGFMQAPVLTVDGTTMNYTEAMEWAKHYKEGA